LGTYFGESPFGISTIKPEVNIKINIREIGYGEED
jgi:hypothetical protein